MEDCLDAAQLANSPIMDLSGKWPIENAKQVRVYKPEREVVRGAAFGIALAYEIPRKRINCILQNTFGQTICLQTGLKFSPVSPVSLLKHRSYAPLTVSKCRSISFSIALFSFALTQAYNF